MKGENNNEKKIFPQQETHLDAGRLQVLPQATNLGQLTGPLRKPTRDPTVLPTPSSSLAD